MRHQYVMAQFTLPLSRSPVDIYFAEKQCDINLFHIVKRDYNIKLNTIVTILVIVNIYNLTGVYYITL